MTIVYFQIWVNPERAFDVNLKSVSIIIIGIILGAVLTSFINNYYDIECDKIAGKQNFFATVSISKVHRLIGVGILACTLFLMSIYPNKAAIVFFLLAVLCVWLYSSDVTRFKEKPVLDLFFDGLGTQFFPALFCFAIINFGQAILSPCTVLLGSAWLFFSNGIRALIIHQTRDKEKDFMAGLRTTVNIFPEKTLNAIKVTLVICEVIFFGGYLLSVDFGVSSIVFVMFLLLSIFLILINKGNPYVIFSIPESKKQRVLLYDVYFILPIIALVLLSFLDKRYILILFAHVLLFHNVLISSVLSKTLR